MPTLERSTVCARESSTSRSSASSTRRRATNRRAAYCFLSAAGLARARLPLEDAYGLYQRAIGLLGDDDAVAKIDALHAAGDLAARLGRTRESIGHFQQFLRLAWWLDLPAKGGAAHDRLGRLHGLLGEHAAALGHLTAGA